MEISNEHKKALDVINDSYYENDDLGKTIEEIIEEHLNRENGRCGYFKGGKYYSNL